MRLLKNMTLAHYASSFPLYWSSYWSSADNVESSFLNFRQVYSLFFLF